MQLARFLCLVHFVARDLVVVALGEEALPVLIFVMVYRIALVIIQSIMHPYIFAKSPFPAVYFTMITDRPPANDMAPQKNETSVNPP